MNASSVNAIQAVWLDPFSPLADADRAQLDAAGISLQTVATLGELHVALRRAHVLIIRLGDNAELLGEVQTLIGQLGHRMPVICRVERRRMEVAVDAMRLGALHVLPADEWSTPLWADAVAALNVKAQAPKSFVFVDPVSQQLLALAQRVAQTEVTALLVGPTGAGKEVLARVLHEASPRAKGPFVALNCAALPEHLIEDMLFGHEKGAFTGAHKEHKGMFEQAHGGTVFLDEIGEMPIHLQAKLLRVLQEKKLNRLGGEATIDLDVRLIAATNKDLRAAIDAREFREDLYFRISTFRLRIQPLRERVGDILPLVAQSLARHAKGGVALSVEPDAQKMLLQYPWPGNVRELENVVQRAVVLCTGRTITPSHLMFDEAMDAQASSPVALGRDNTGEASATDFDTPLFAPPALAEAAPAADSAADPMPMHSTLGVLKSAVTHAMNDAAKAMLVGLPAKGDHSDVSAGWSLPPTFAPEADSFSFSRFGTTDPIQPTLDGLDLQHAVKVSEHQMIMSAIQTTESRVEAARKLGISPRTLRYKLAQLRERGMHLAFAD
ncbi:AtoC Response regulator containing CheY-like receiver, AAA-type ATPase, and DNA-binding domains [Burkholderiaceae bacterium]